MPKRVDQSTAAVSLRKVRCRFGGGRCRAKSSSESDAGDAGEKTDALGTGKRWLKLPAGCGCGGGAIGIGALPGGCSV